VVKELSPSGNTEEVQHAFDLMEQWLVNGNHKVRDLVVIGFLRQNGIYSFLRPQSRNARNEIERVWSGKSSLMEVVREERKTQR
jgi:hypothetical protein